MKNFETQCSVDGTSALQPEFQHAPAHAGNIIDFSTRAICCSHPSTQRVSFGIAPRSGQQANLFKNEMTHSLRYGAIGGISYDRVKPWQAALAACTFSALAFASLFVGL